MKKYSSTYPLIFGIIFFMVGVCAGQIAFALLFGGIPIALGIWLKSKERPKEKVCCARCGVDISILPKKNAFMMDGQIFCDVCARKILEEKARKKTQKPIAQPQSKPTPQPQNNPSPVKKLTTVCARCKKSLFYDETVLIGNHLFCKECAKAPAAQWDNSELVRSHRKLAENKLLRVLRQIETIKKEEAVAGVCSVCCRQFSYSELIFADGDYYCRDCFSFAYDKEGAKASTGLQQISYEIKGIIVQSLLSPVTEVVDRLLAGGFQFHKASVGGGVNEISHSGIMAYNAVYTDYADFKNNMESDFQKREQAEYNQTGGYVSSLDYSWICAYLSRNTLKVYVLSECGRLVLRWFDESDKMFPVTRGFAEAVNAEVYQKQYTLRQIDNMEADESFLANWL